MDIRLVAIILLGKKIIFNSNDKKVHVLAVTTSAQAVTLLARIGKTISHLKVCSLF